MDNCGICWWDKCSSYNGVKRPDGYGSVNHQRAIPCLTCKYAPNNSLPFSLLCLLVFITEKETTYLLKHRKKTMHLLNLRNRFSFRFLWIPSAQTARVKMFWIFILIQQTKLINGPVSEQYSQRARMRPLKGHIWSPSHQFSTSGINFNLPVNLNCCYVNLKFTSPSLWHSRCYSHCTDTRTSLYSLKSGDQCIQKKSHLLAQSLVKHRRQAGGFPPNHELATAGLGCGFIVLSFCLPSRYFCTIRLNMTD